MISRMKIQQNLYTINTACIAAILVVLLYLYNVPEN